MHSKYFDISHTRDRKKWAGHGYLDESADFELIARERTLPLAATTSDYGFIFLECKETTFETSTNKCRCHSIWFAHTNVRCHFSLRRVPAGMEKYIICDIYPYTTPSSLSVYPNGTQSRDFSSAFSVNLATEVLCRGKTSGKTSGSVLP